MPVRNEADFIARSLGAIFAQDYPDNCMEILVADGQSIDATRDEIRKVSITHPDIPVHIIDNPGHIVPCGMNLAMREAKGEIIVRVDGHCEIAPDYVSKCVQHILDDGVDAVGGPIETVGSTPLSRAIALAMSSTFGVGGSAFRTIKGKAMLADTIPFPAYTRRAIETAGPYDEELMRNQDDEYNYRLRKLGFKLLLSPDIRSVYYSRGSLRSLWRQYYQYGVYKVRVLQKHPAQMQARQFVPVLFVIGLFGGIPLTLFSPLFGGIWLSAIGLYFLLDLVISVQLGRRAGWEMFRYLPLIFPILHVSYGLGFIRGLFVFRGRWREK